MNAKRFLSCVFVAACVVAATARVHTSVPSKASARRSLIDLASVPVDVEDVVTWSCKRYNLKLRSIVDYTVSTVASVKTYNLVFKVTDSKKFNKIVSASVQVSAAGPKVITWLGTIDNGDIVTVPEEQRAQVEAAMTGLQSQSKPTCTLPYTLTAFHGGRTLINNPDYQVVDMHITRGSVAGPARSVVVENEDGTFVAAEVEDLIDLIDQSDNTISTFRDGIQRTMTTLNATCTASLTTASTAAATACNTRLASTQTTCTEEKAALQTSAAATLLAASESCTAATTTLQNTYSTLMAAAAAQTAAMQACIANLVSSASASSAAATADNAEICASQLSITCKTDTACTLPILGTKAAQGNSTVMATFTYDVEASFPSLFNADLTESDRAGAMTGEACKTLTTGQFCADYPSVFSSLTLSPRSRKDELRMIGSSDRGPNSDCPNDVKGFLTPNFAPYIIELKANTKTNKLHATGFCNLKLASGQKVTGLPNLAKYDDVPADRNCANASTSTEPAFAKWASTGGYDVHGIDLEDVTYLGNGLCAGSDEYAPSILVFKCDFNAPSECGTIVARYIPEDKGAAYLAAAGADGAYFKPILPKAFTNRRNNRGLESVAASPDGKTLIALLQSSMGPSSSGTTTQYSSVLMAVELDMTNPVDAQVNGMYILLADDKVPVTYASGSAKDIKASGLGWAAQFVPNINANAKVLVVDERKSSEVHINLLDFTGATDLRPILAAKGDDLFFDKLSHTVGRNSTAISIALAGEGVQPVRKAILAHTGKFPYTAASSAKWEGWTGSEKQEGLMLLDDCVLAIGDDNDFAIKDVATIPSALNVIQMRTCVSDAYKALL